MTATTVPYGELDRLVTSIFAAYGLPAADAARVAEGLLYADSRNVGSHGISRIPTYAQRLRDGVTNPRPSLALTESAPAAVLVDGDNGMGFVVSTRAMAEAVKRAQTFGVGLALAKNSSHFGMAAIYLQQAIDAGMAAMVQTNATAAMPVWGGRTPFLGTSPFGLGVPGATPLILDMATSVAARGKIRRAVARGEAIPEGWALDPEGRPTTDAKAAYDGVVLPIAGPKGSGLSLVMEAMAGVMSGAAFGGEVGNPYVDFDKPQRTGHLFMAFRPDLFMAPAQYAERIGELVRRAKAQPLAEGFDEILMPGEREARLAAERRANGLPVAADDLAMLQEEAKLAGVPGL